MPSASAFAARHRQRVGVVEAERDRGLQPARREPAIQLVERGIAVALEQLANDRSGVLRVEVDRAAGERLLEDAGVAEAGLVDARPAGAGERLGEDLAEHVRLGEPLRADDQGRRVGSDGRPARHERAGPSAMQTPTHRRNSPTGRRALLGLLGPAPCPTLGRFGVAEACPSLASLRCRGELSCELGRCAASGRRRRRHDPAESVHRRGQPRHPGEPGRRARGDGADRRRRHRRGRSRARCRGWPTRRTAAIWWWSTSS